MKYGHPRLVNLWLACLNVTNRGRPRSKKQPMLGIGSTSFVFYRYISLFLIPELRNRPILFNSVQFFRSYEGVGTVILVGVQEKRARSMGPV